ncbi:MAG: LemA family protein [Actinomycetota bacterium]|nr:LemA family protein [Actinomycetota bacterium]
MAKWILMGIAVVLGSKEHEYFEADDTSRRPVSVQF